jgi:AraC-like DNA-binding protein
VQTTIPQSLYSAMRFNFLYVDKYTFHSGWFFPEDYIPYCLLRFITRGEAVFKINGEEIIVHKNEIAYIPEGAVMSCWALSDNIEFYSIRFCVTARLNNSDFLGEYFHIPTITKNAQEIVLTYFQEIYQGATSQNPSRLFRIRGNLELILAYLTQRANAEGEAEVPSEHDVPDAHSLEAIRRRNAKTQNINRDPRIQVVVDYLTPHLNESFTIQSLSEMAQVSQTSFRRLFKAHTGKSPSDYIRELRMTSAARMLLTSDREIAEIGYQVGFSDANYFSRTFRQVFGVSPHQYRRISRGQTVRARKESPKL